MSTKFAKRCWLGVHLDSIRGGLTFPHFPFLTSFLNHFQILRAQLSPIAQHILACFSVICARHKVTLSLNLFRFLFTFQINQSGHSQGIVNIKSWGSTCCIESMPDNNKGWKGRCFVVKLDKPFPNKNIWGKTVPQCPPPWSTPTLREMTMKIDVKGYIYHI